MNFVRLHKGLFDSVRASSYLMKNSLVFTVLVAAAACVALATSTHSNVNEHGVVMNRRELEGTAVFESVCSVTLYPDVCVSTLLAHPESRKAASSKELATIVVKVTLYELKNLSASLGSEMSRQRITDQRSQSAVDDCLELFGYSLRQLNDSLGSLQSSEWRRQEADDVQTWLSASLTNQDTCIEGVNGHNYGNPMLPDGALRKVWKLLSNSLAMVKNISPAGIDRRRLIDPIASLDNELFSVADGFPSWLSPADRRLLQVLPSGIRANAVVAKDGSGHYKTITEAINAAPSKSKGRYIIYVRAGIYAERVKVSKDGIMLVGDGKDVTIVTGKLSGVSLKSISNFIATGNGFIARDMGFENTAGPRNHQAIALLVGSDHSALYRCSIKGYQDTLYAYTQRQFYRECDIYGSVDFIFGNAVAVFQSCNILARKGLGGRSFITAQGRIDPNQNTGFSIHMCRVIAADKNSDPTYLGRPWKPYSRTVYMQSYLDKIIAPAGWYPWSGNFALKTLYYGEYMNTGPGAGTANRVNWPGYHRITSTAEASKYTVAEFISGNSWLPSTGVAFQAGLTTS